MNRFILILGSNLGDRKANLGSAIQEIAWKIGTIQLESSVYETAPWGNTRQSDFINQVVAGETELSAAKLMSVILAIESGMGRVRKNRWEPRIIDIDILFYNNEIIHQPGLSIPHPHVHERKFVLEPLAEIFPDLIHPVSGKRVSQLLLEVKDPLTVHKLQPN